MLRVCVSACARFVSAFGREWHSAWPATGGVPSSSMTASRTGKHRHMTRSGHCCCPMQRRIAVIARLRSTWAPVATLDWPQSCSVRWHEVRAYEIAARLASRSSSTACSTRKSRELGSIQYSAWMGCVTGKVTYPDRMSCTSSIVCTLLWAVALRINWSALALRDPAENAASSWL